MIGQRETRSLDALLESTFFRDARDTTISSLAAPDAHEPCSACHQPAGHVSGN